MIVGTIALCFFMGADKPGCGQGLNNRKGESGIDVGGAAGATWDVGYSDTVEVVLKNAGGVISTQTVSLAGGGTIEMEGIPVDLAAFCAREDVACPQEIFPKVVTMTQPGSELHLLYITYNKVGPMVNVEQQTLLGNVDSDFDFSIALGVGGALIGPCGLLSVSYATGSITSANTNPPRGVKLTGDIVTAYHGGCLVSGSKGTAAAGLTVELRIPFWADRR